MKPKKLIEVALPIKEISAESVRDKSIRHGHISTLHLWWARRPLPVCRAIVFASLVPDPDDPNCPQAFRDAVQDNIVGAPGSLIYAEYKTYPDIPYTAIYDPMAETLRNRLMMFIGKFSDKCQKDMIAGKSTTPKDQLAEGSLIKWENKNNPKILGIARVLIWVAYNAEQYPEKSYSQLKEEFNEAFGAIKKAENHLYGIVDRQNDSPEVQKAENALKEAIEAFQSRMPSVFDPFAGGGAIPLEAARLGCRSYGNDINPVAHIIERGSAEFPQKYGKPIIYSVEEFKSRYGQKGVEMAQRTDSGITVESDGYHVPNRLAFDVEFYAKKLLEMTEAEVGHLYPKDEKGNKPVAYYWVRTVKCTNPSCNARVPLLKQFYLANTKTNQIYLRPTINGNDISFEIVEGRYNSKILKGWNNRGNLTCPCCGSVTGVEQVKDQSCNVGLKPKLIAVISNEETGKNYSIPSENLIQAVNIAIPSVNRPMAPMMRNSNGGDTIPWGFTRWGDLISDRQLYVINSFINNLSTLKKEIELNEYGECLITYLAIWLDRICTIQTTFGRWNSARETIEHMYSRQAIAMVSDFPEANPFSGKTGSAINQLDWILRYLESESPLTFSCDFANASSGEKSQFKEKSLTAVVTDPPYYDAISYADISDFFYVWLKRTLKDVYPLNFATPQTPKAEECTAIKYHHNNNYDEAKKHFENKLTQIFDAIEVQTRDIVSIMFAHQSTEAWTTLCNSILRARMNISGSWPIDSERDVRMLAIAGAALESSVTVACRPSERKGFGDFKEVKSDIENKVIQEVESLYELGFRGADLLTACFGQAVSEFGKFKVVEKSNGDSVSVGELLELARTAAFDALLQGVQGDDYTRFYIGWLQLNGLGVVDNDDAAKFTRVGVNVELSDVRQQKLLILEGNRMHLALAAEHLTGHIQGRRPEDSLIDQAHRAILLMREGERNPVLHFVHNIAPDASSPLWRLLATLKELLPADTEDYKDVQSLLQNADDLRQSAKSIEQPTIIQGSLFDEENEPL